METSVFGQLLETAAALGLGAAAGLFYDILRVIRGRLPLKIVTLLCDLVFSIAAGGALFVLGMTMGGGRQRALTAILSVLGGVLYFLTLTKPATYILEGIADLTSLSVRLLSFPAAFLIKTLKNFAFFSKKAFNYGLGWYIFRERRALSSRGAHSKRRKDVVREKSRNSAKASRVRRDSDPRMDDYRPVRGYYESNGSEERIKNAGGGD
ncbi:MAG: hypothetical protein GX823_02235 [Clostridiales bacterium]|nr:hypothetical protein [Clostridiales bacterium]